MRELNWFEKLLSKYLDIRAAMCFHVFEEDFSEQIKKGWGQSSGVLICKKCGTAYPYYFNFKKKEE